ncbi:glyoxalase superfamily protein [Novosphingobium aquimarinum]|uniref:glyoxalase superfamily protein n=1 Tax=Novosphingobium aquimarinum TaxID=2682494 RepID=UPI0012EC24CA|nr:glyoxalase superfamily protein [Novosphingobium aquimarinum]
MTIRTIADAKKRAAALREAALAKGQALSQGKALETVAKEEGARDWNTLRARLASVPASGDGFDGAALTIGGEVEGRYMNQPFTGRLVDAASEGQGFRVAIHLDQAVDTVTFASFSNLRRRIRGVIGKDGRSAERTSDGVPHLVISKIRK